MRQRFQVVLAAGGRWPDTENGRNLPPFNWAKVDNRGTNGVDVALVSNAAAGNLIDTILTVSGGKVRVFNLAGPTRPGADNPDAGEAWPQELHLVSASGTTVVIEIADHPIVDLTLAT